MPSHRYGAPAQVIETWRAEAFELLVSEPILSEYERALRYRQVQVRHGLSASVLLASFPLAGISLCIDQTALAGAIADGARAV